jgi:hypothetical protein
MVCLLSILNLTLIYAYALFDFVQNGCEASHWKCDIKKDDLVHVVNVNVEKYIQSICYLVGVYVNIRDKSIIISNGVHFILFLIICLDAYVQKLQNYLNDKVIEKDKLVKLLLKHNALYKREYLNEEDDNKIEMKDNIIMKGMDEANDNNNNNKIQRCSERFSEIDKLESIKKNTKMIT